MKRSQTAKMQKIELENKKVNLTLTVNKCYSQ